MRDQTTEDTLKTVGVDWVYVEFIEFSKINMVKSQANPGRLGDRLEIERAKHYGVRMKAGDVFKAIVLLNDLDSHDLWEVGTGMHRTRGAESVGILGHSAYLVTSVDAYKRELLIRSLNNKEGVAPDTRERMQQALALSLNNPSMSKKQISDDMNVKLAGLQNEIRAYEVDVTARRLGFELKNVSNTSKVEIGKIKTDSLLSEILKVITDKDLIGQDLDKLILRVRNASTVSEQAAIDEIKTFRDELVFTNRRKGRGRLTPTGHVVRAIKALASELRKYHNTVDLTSLNSEDVINLQNLINDHELIIRRAHLQASVLRKMVKQLTRRVVI